MSDNIDDSYEQTQDFIQGLLEDIAELKDELEELKAGKDLYKIATDIEIDLLHKENARLEAENKEMRKFVRVVSSVKSDNHSLRIALNDLRIKATELLNKE